MPSGPQNGVRDGNLTFQAQSILCPLSTHDARRSPWGKLALLLGPLRGRSSTARCCPHKYVASGKVTADRNLRDEIAKRGLRELMPTTGLSQHTIEAIREGKPVRRNTLQRLVLLR
jgi:hypothetical protein